ncbi:hypothetical protein ACQX25_11930, partial [Corynebacterium diphtheriae]
RELIITAIIADFSSGYTISDMSQSSDLIQSAQRRGMRISTLFEDAARTALEGKTLQLDRVGVIGTHLNSLGCSFSLRHHAWDNCLRQLDTCALRGPNWRRTISLLT